MEQVLNRNFTPEGVLFPSELPGGVNVAFPLDASDASTAEVHPPALRLLESLWLEDRLITAEAGYLLPIAEVYRLEAEEARLLGLPAGGEPVEVELRSSAYPGSADFIIRPVTRHARRGVLPPNSRIGAFFIAGDELLLVPEPVAELFRVLDSGSSRVLGDQFLYLGEVKKAAERCGAELDAFLDGEEVIIPDQIGVEVEVEAPDRLRVRPVLHGVEDANVFPVDQGPTRGVYMHAQGTQRRRLVLGPEERAATDALKKRGELRGADVARFFNNPEAFLPDQIDLGRYSMRVRGLIPQRYNSQPYVRPQASGKRGWFDVGVELEAAVFKESAGAGEGGSAGGVGAEPGAAGDPFAECEGGAGSAAQDPSTPAIDPAEYADLCEQVLATGERHVLHNGAWVEIDPTIARQYLDAWELTEDDGYGGRGIPAERVPLVLDVISNLLEAEFVEEAASDAILPELPEYTLPESLHAELMPHQQVGYRWLRYLHERGLGGLLADDMGLGKTVQVISLLAHLADAGQLQPALVVLPTSLIENWQRELVKFCPRIKRVYLHSGQDRLRNPNAIAQFEVVLTTYETLRRDQLMLGLVDWSVIACDEAQKVKNPTAQITSAVKGMKAQLRLAMTGTPVENGLSELWCIVDWAQPGKLGGQKEFRDRFERPMREADDERRTELALQLQHELTPHYIRRVKEDVLDGLPPRNDLRHLVEMGPRQIRLYAEIVRQVHSGKMVPIEGLQHLIAVASHAELYEESGRPIQALIEECPKLEATLEILDEVQDRGEKAILFTRYRGMQRILQSAIAARFGTHAAILNGEVAAGRRLGLVDHFNRAPGFGALILSPEAAGVGLNIVGANHVVHYTRLWNPAKENQATDRAHRIGQTRPVAVHYPIIGGGEVATVEERLDALLAEKQALARDVVRPRESLSVERELLDIFQTPVAA